MLKPRNAFDLALDLGTAATRIHVGSRLTQLARPSTIWRSGATQPALAGGVVCDAEAASTVLRDLLRSVPRSRFRPLRALACVPTDASNDERARLVDAVHRAGVGAVSIAPEPLAAAIGAGLDPESPCAQLLVDIGEGVTDCAVVRGGKLVATRALRVAVADVRLAATAWIESGAGIRVVPVEAERVLRAVGVGPIVNARRSVRVVGSPLHGAGPIVAPIEIDDLHDAIEPVVDSITACVGQFVAELPAELAAEVRDSGLCLTGGGALLSGMLERLVGETAMAVWRAPDPLRAVIDGAHRLAASRTPLPAWS